MNATIVQKIVQLIMNDPDLREQFLAAQPEIKPAAQPEVLVLLNYAPHLEKVLQKLAVELGNGYQIKVLGTDAVKPEQLVLPPGMDWLSCSDAFKHGKWQRVILPTCSANTLVKIALGIRDNVVCELAGRAIAQGIPVELSTDCLGFTDQTPLAYRQLYAGYIGRLRKYGVVVKDQPGNLLALEAELKAQSVNYCEAAVPHMYQVADTMNAPVSDYTRAAVICWEGKLMTEQDVVNLPEESVVKVARKAIISPLAKDKLRQRQIEIVREMEV